MKEHAMQPIYVGLAALLYLSASVAFAQDPEPIRTVELGPNNCLLVNGKPFIPLMSWAQDSKRFPMLRSLGFNTFAGNFNRQPPAREFCDLAQAAGGYALPDFDAAAKGHPALLGYLQPDEPDLGIEKGKPRMTAGDIVAAYKDMKAQDPTRPVWLGITAHFMVGPGWAGTPTPAEKQAYYSAITEGGDVIGFDVYPIYGWNQDKQLIWVADGVTQLRPYAGPRPVEAAIETCKGSQWITYERQKDVLPMHTRAEVWMAIIRGARGITYFTHAWRPAFTEFAPTPEMQAELKRLNGQIARLTPAICAAPTNRQISMTMADGLPCHFMSNEQGGALYVFAQNTDMSYRAGSGTLTVEGLKAGTTVEVVDENRTIVAAEGQFTDSFGPMAEHIYRAVLPAR
jgi:hypothetical protein